MGAKNEIPVDDIVSKAEAGDAAAQERLGLLYAEGAAGLAADPARAREWYTRAAEQDDPGGHFGLAMLYINGLGVAPDRVQAYMHLLLMKGRAAHLARRWNKPTAIRMIAVENTLKKKLSESERAKAGEGAKAWRRRTGG